MRSCVPPRRCTMPSPDHAPRIEVNVLCAWAGGVEITVSANAPKPTLRQRDGRSCNIILPPTDMLGPGAKLRAILGRIKADFINFHRPYVTFVIAIGPGWE